MAAFHKLVLSLGFLSMFHAAYSAAQRKQVFLITFLLILVPKFPKHFVYILCIPQVSVV